MESKPILGAEDTYVIYSNGSIESKGRVVHKSDGTIQTFKAKKISSHVASNGYPMVTLKINNKWVGRTIHSLVAEVFLLSNSKLPEKMCVNHINGIKTDNRAENLEVISFGENLKHAHRIGLNKNIGETHCYSTLSFEDVLKIREINPKGFDTVKVAKQFGICKDHVRKILRKKKRINS